MRVDVRLVRRLLDGNLVFRSGARWFGRRVLGSFVWIRPFDRNTPFEDTETRADDAAAPSVADLESDVVESQPRDDLLEQLERHADLQAGAQEHVSGNARDAVEQEIAAGE